MTGRDTLRQTCDPLQSKPDARYRGLGRSSHSKRGTPYGYTPGSRRARRT